MKRQIFEELMNSVDIPVFHESRKYITNYVNFKTGKNYSFLNARGMYRYFMVGETHHKFIFVDKNQPLYIKIPVLIHEIDHYHFFNREGHEKKSYKDIIRTEREAFEASIEKCIDLQLLDSLRFIYKTLSNFYSKYHYPIGYKRLQAVYDAVGQIVNTQLWKELIINIHELGRNKNECEYGFKKIVF